MWFLVPILVSGFLLLKRSRNGSEEVEELPYRRIYICHSLYDTKSYKKVVRKLKLSDDFKVMNHSIPKHKQRENDGDDELRDIFRGQMKNCTHVFVLATSDLPQKSYVKMELEVAKELGKKIIAETITTFHHLSESLIQSIFQITYEQFKNL